MTLAEILLAAAVLAAFAFAAYTAIKHQSATETIKELKEIIKELKKDDG